MKLGDLIDFNPSIRLAKREVAPFIGMAALPTKDRYIRNVTTKAYSGSGSRFKDGDTLFARITPCLENGKGGFVSGLGNNVTGHGSTEFIVFRSKNPSDRDFIYYVSRLPEFRRHAEQQMMGTSGRQRVAWQSLENFEIRNISPQERVQIGKLLTLLDDKIELNRRMNETLEAMARAIFKDWLVDFGPTRAKAEGREPYLAPELWDLFPDALDDEDRPVGWKQTSLCELVEFNPKEPLQKGIVAPYLAMNALPTSGAIPEPPIPRAFSSGMRFRNGDTLFARITPCLENGKTCFVQQLPPGTVGWGSTEFIVMRSQKPLPACFTYLVARDTSFRTHAIQSMTGTSGRQRARTEALENFPFCQPKEPLWEAFASIVEPVFNKIAANGAESLVLAETRDLLLPKLMSGEIRLREAEKAVEAVA